MVEICSVHEVPGGCPVTVAIEQSSDDAATQHSFESFLILLGVEFCDDLLTVGKAPNVQTFRVGWSTTEAGKIWCVGFLDTFFRHEWFISCVAAKTQRGDDLNAFNGVFRVESLPGYGLKL